jgi:lysophospholipid hydrolase
VYTYFYTTHTRTIHACTTAAIQSLLQIPVDYIAGTSIGAFVGGLYAMDDNLLSILPKANSFAKTMGSMWGYIKDLTLPITSYFSGYGFNHETQLAFGRTRIEDLWITC